MQIADSLLCIPSPIKQIVDLCFLLNLNIIPPSVYVGERMRYQKLLGKNCVIMTHPIIALGYNVYCMHAFCLMNR